MSRFARTICSGIITTVAVTLMMQLFNWPIPAKMGAAIIIGLGSGCLWARLGQSRGDRL